jgi:hypothetical protein
MSRNGMIHVSFIINCTPLKAVEYIGTVQMVLSIWENVPYAYCQAVVMDYEYGTT